MTHYWSLEGIQLGEVWLAIGSFDGVHLGHQAVIQQLAVEAHQSGAMAVVLTFFPHPAVVLNNYKGPLYLTSPERRAELLSQLSTDVVITHSFNREVATLSARQFLEILSKHMVIKQLWAGQNFTMGKDREADMMVLSRLGEELGFEVTAVPLVEINGEIISSSQIRALLSRGQVEEAARKLGRPYQLCGQVIPGDGRGHQIGIPTANLKTMEQKLLPARGVYACKAYVEGKHWLAATNIGVRPTFDGLVTAEHSTIETHILDFHGDLYGKEIDLEFLSRLRGEQRFTNVAELVSQIHQDIAQIREMVRNSHYESLPGFA